MRRPERPVRWRDAPGTPRNRTGKFRFQSVRGGSFTEFPKWPIKYAGPPNNVVPPEAFRPASDTWMGTGRHCIKIGPPNATLASLAASLTTAPFSCSSVGARAWHKGRASNHEFTQLLSTGNALLFGTVIIAIMRVTCQCTQPSGPLSASIGVEVHSRNG